MGGNEKEISNLNTFSLLKFDNLKFSCKKFELQKPIKSHALLTLNDNIDFRPYQIQGINWLNFLNNYNLNGILADDMGLGKTLQVIASLAWSLGNGNELNRNNKNILIVCPSSLIYHWKSEFLKFTCLREEENFVLLDKLKKFDQELKDFKNNNQNNKLRIFITSYSIVTRSSNIQNFPNFNHLILDEGHILKNPTSQIYQKMV